MKVVYKYDMPMPGNKRLLELPCEFEPLRLAIQDGAPKLWALVETGSEDTRKTFRTYATGEPVTVGSIYVGTYFIDWTVWHVFYE